MNRLEKFLAYSSIIICSIIILFFGITTVICLGPSIAARDLFVTSVMETSAAKFLAKMYFSDKEIEQIIEKNSLAESNEITDTSFAFDVNSSKKDIEIIDITGTTFKGKLMIIKDPSRIKLEVLSSFSSNKKGKKVEEFVKDADAIAGINAGGFEDVNGVGIGGQPLGLVIKNGAIINGTPERVDTLVGFDKNNKLIVGKMSGIKALQIGMRDAVSFGPIFIINGKPQNIAGSGSGLNPRSVIGQRKDGSVLLLVIDGRQAHSIGATYEDCIDVMVKYDAYTAANLDGGSSSLLVYNDKIITSCASLYGSRRMPAAFVVEKIKNKVDDKND